MGERLETRRAKHALAAVLTAALTVVGLSACGGSSGGPPQLTYFIAIQPGGTVEATAERCTKEAEGKYTIKPELLPNDASQAREQLVRRLGAKDSSIDVIGLDVILTSEFANAGWISPWKGKQKEEASKDAFKSVLRTATFENELYAAPFNTNTQLLWYRKDLVQNPPDTWDALISSAAKVKQAPLLEIQGAQYEGVVVWFNALVQSAGGTIINGNKVTIGPAAQKAAQIMSLLAHSPAADPSLASDKEDQNRLAFETGKAVYEINYPFIYPSAKADNPKLFKNIGWKPYPSVVTGQPAKPPIGGINWGVSAYSKHKADAFAAAACLRDAQNQKEAAIKGGLPPTLSAVYDDPEMLKAYPFGPLIRRQVESAGVRPQTPAYADVSLAIATSVSPPENIKVNGFTNALNSKLDDALNSRGLF
jgi:multiple sugar transport system substrate-binding protein